MLHLGSHMTHVAEMNGTNNLSGHPKVLLSHTPNGPELLEFSAQLSKEPELLCKEQKQGQPRRCLVSAESHRCGAAPLGLLVASPSQQCDSFVLSGA